MRTSKLTMSGRDQAPPDSAPSMSQPVSVDQYPAEEGFELLWPLAVRRRRKVAR